MPRRSIKILLLALISWCSVRPSHAHAGPPFPILSDEEIPGYVVSIWADPDIGEALFYIVLEPRESVKAPPVLAVEFWVEPLHGGGSRKSYPVHQQKARRHLRYVATPEFAMQEFWKVGVEIKAADGNVHRFTAEVESTPPGLGRWDLLLYLFPFVLFGGLWVMVMVRKTKRRRRNGREHADAATIAKAQSTVYYLGAP